MKMKPISSACVIAALLVGAAQAQDDETSTPLAVPVAVAQSGIDHPQAAEDPNPDEMADDLNSRQQLQQTFRLQRTIDGKVVDSEQRTVTYTRDQPYYETEAGGSTIDKLKQAFDGELLTRMEAFEEAKRDFTAADNNHDGVMTKEEFVALVQSWKKTDANKTPATPVELTRQQQYDAFLAEINPEAAQQQNDAKAIEKFQFMAGAGDTITRDDYIREYLLDFDSMDADKDTLLKGDELMRFRAVNRGDTLEM